MSSFPRLSCCFPLLLLFLFSSVPFVITVHNAPFATIYNDTSALLIGILLCFWAFSPKRSVSTSDFLLVLVVFLAYLIIQPWLLDENYVRKYYYAFYYVFWGILMIQAGNYLHAQLSLIQILRHLAWGFVCGGIVNAAFAYYQVITQDLVFGTLNQINNYSDYMALSFASAIYLMLERRIDQIKGICFISVPFIFFIMISGSRTALLYIIFIFLSLMKLRDRMPRYKLLLPVVILASCFFLFLAQKLNLSHGIRPILFLQAWLDFVDNPILGIGFHNYFYQLTDTQWSMHSHNFILQMMSEVGAVGVILLSLSVWFWLQDWPGVRGSPEYWFIANILMILVIHSMLEYPLWYANFLGIFCLTVGFVGDTWTVRFSRWNRIFYWAVLLIILGLLVAFLLEYHGFFNKPLVVILEGGATIETISSSFFNK